MYKTSQSASFLSTLAHETVKAHCVLISYLPIGCLLQQVSKNSAVTRLSIQQQGW
jgi:hypothetical protein